MKTILDIIFSIPVLIVINAILGADHPWWAYLSVDATSFIISYVFISSVRENKP